MNTESPASETKKSKRPRLSPEQKLEQLLAQQRELEDRIRKEKAAAKKRADEAAKIQQLRIAKLVLDAGISHLDDKVLAEEFAAIAKKHSSKATAQ